uniref:Uncharacterized protein n=1 Tax=Candidatus Kentrum sp. LPFa TaxID=2126335 RepID=A0A450W979_9GAMM|nr:MAG: hypothetical protein BECKLPF1236B_GA0070989_104912 [Candidatus Kentron sp. LPFa]
MSQKEDYDASRQFSHGDRVTTIDPSERLKFARQILLGLAVICVAVFVGYAWYPGNKALIAIFELVKIGILPLATLIVAFYFPTSG